MLVTSESSITGTISAGDVIEGVDSGATATVTSTIEDRLLINTKLGEFFVGDWLFKDTTSTEAKVSAYDDKRGVLTGNTGGRITIDVETINSGWQSGDVIYGSKTEKILDLVGIRDGGTPITINTYIHGDRTIRLSSQVLYATQDTQVTLIRVIRYISFKEPQSHSLDGLDMLPTGIIAQMKVSMICISVAFLVTQVFPQTLSDKVVTTSVSLKTSTTSQSSTVLSEPTQKQHMSLTVTS